MQPAAYRRRTAQWSTWLGRIGTVIASTVVNVTAFERTDLAPYSYVLVQFKSERRSFMGAGHEVFAPGDKVCCVWRRSAEPTPTGIIAYGIKVSHA